MQTLTMDEPALDLTATDPWTRPKTPLDLEPRTTDLVELMLKDRKRLDALIRDESKAAEIVPRLLGVAVVGFTMFGIAATLILNVAPDRPPWVPRASWSDSTCLSLTLAYVGGLIGAAGVCLPSFYFYGLLAGVKLSMLSAAAHSVRCLAMTSVVLVGALPIYVAVALGTIVFGAPGDDLRAVINLGLALPFIAGLWGVHSLYECFTALADDLPTHRQANRACFLRRLTLAWAACYTTVTPVMIYWLWTRLSA